MMLRSIQARVFLLSALVISALVGCDDKREELSLVIRNEDGTSTPPITAEISNSPQETSLGLMYRKSMAEDRGMLFIFPGDAPRSFWMKNTYIELDIVFIDSERKVVSLVERAKPHTETPRPSLGPARYVLEIGGGLASKWGIKPGSKLDVPAPLPSAE
ncbi:MAG: DUF192 domain-containing protein [Deltaproteobacteria bacterium]|nr:DUF192 domain-containing protein [Deltaproteobacteria bacterium]